MNISELQNDIIANIRNINDKDLLNFYRELLLNKLDQNIYKLSNFEKNMIKESNADYEKGNIIDHDQVFENNKKWLEE